MKVLVGRVFGIGNACISIPMINSLLWNGHEVHVLVGTTPDDVGASDVFFSSGLPVKVHEDFVDLHEHQFDVAVMAIPFDGRWKNGVHFNAIKVIDGRTRPDPLTIGFSSWERHESKYQLECLWQEKLVGGSLSKPSHLIDGHHEVGDIDRVYVGIGFKRDPGGFGASKHFGNDRFTSVLNKIRTMRPSVRFLSTGTPKDVSEVCSRIYCPEYWYTLVHDLPSSIKIMKTCSAYFGNDTGMMHVAAALDRKVFGLFAYPKLITKNRPLCDQSYSVHFVDMTDDEIASQFVDFHWGKRE